MKIGLYYIYIYIYIYIETHMRKYPDDYRNTRRKWIERPQILTPNGFNIKLNNLQIGALKLGGKHLNRYMLIKTVTTNLKHPFLLTGVLIAWCLR